MKKILSPRLMLIVSMLIFGTLGAFVKNIPVSSGELALYRALMAVVCVSLFLLLTKQKLNFKEIKGELPLLLLSGVTMGVNWVLLFEAYKYTTVSVATLCYYFAPVIVMVLSPLLFKERLTAKQIICFSFSTVGLVMITGIGVGGASNNFLGIAFGLSAAVFYASVVILNKKIKKVEGLPRTLLQFLSAIAVLLVYVIINGEFSLSKLDAGGWASLIAVGVLHTGFAYCLYFSSLKALSGQQAAILSYIDPLVAVIVSVTVLQETITIWQIAGGALILGFTLFNEIKLKK